MVERPRPLFAAWAAARLHRLSEHIPRLWPVAVAIGVVLLVGVVTRVRWPNTLTPDTGVAVLESVPSGSQVFVDGRALGTTPLSTTLPAGSHMVEFRFRKATRTARFDLVGGGHIVQRIDWTSKSTGRLQVRSDPPGARVLVDGVARGETPLMLDDLPVGSHALVLERGGGSVRRSVNVSATETAQVSATMLPGWITIFSPFDLTITDGSQAIRLDDRHQVMLSPGMHELSFENRALGYKEVRQVDVHPGGIASLSIVPPRSIMTVTATVPAEVWLDGVLVGQTPLVKLPVDLGTREVVLKNAAGEERRFTTTVTVKPVDLAVDFSKPAF